MLCMLYMCGYGYQIVGNFQGRKLSQIAEETIVDCLLVSPPKNTMPLNFEGENFCKTSNFAKVFSLKSFLLYECTVHIN